MKVTGSARRLMSHISDLIMRSESHVEILNLTHALCSIADSMGREDSWDSPKEEAQDK